MVRLRSPQVCKNSGQAALILIMIMAVIGAGSVSVAAREVEIETAGSQAEGAAGAGIELALSTRADVPQTQVGTGNVTYQATYASLGSTGFVAGEVEEGDLVAVSLSGAVGVTAINIYWNNTAAVFASLLNANQATGDYILKSSETETFTYGFLHASISMADIAGGVPDALWLEITIDGNTLDLIELNAVPWALRAGRADSCDSLSPEYLASPEFLASLPAGVAGADGPRPWV